MKEVRGIKGLSISSILVNGGLFGVMILSLLAVAGLAPFKEEGFIILVLLSLAMMATLAYPLQLLLIRRRYYRDIPISSRTRVFTHLSRIIQLLYTLLLVWAIVVSVYNIYKYKEMSFRSNSALILQVCLSLMVVAAIILNLILFFKGWRLLKQTRKSYIDEVMATFDDVDLTKQ